MRIFNFCIVQVIVHIETKNVMGSFPSFELHIICCKLALVNTYLYFNFHTLTLKIFFKKQLLRKGTFFFALGISLCHFREVWRGLTQIFAKRMALFSASSYIRGVVSLSLLLTLQVSHKRITSKPLHME